jgi:hypothetical protein
MPPLIANVRFPEVDLAGDSLSATCTEKLDDPAAVGVPVMAPAVLSDSPAGRLPDVRLQL